MSPRRKKAERPTVIAVRLTKREEAKLKAEHRELWPSLSWSAFLRQRLGLSEIRVPLIRTRQKREAAYHPPHPDPLDVEAENDSTMSAELWRI